MAAMPPGWSCAILRAVIRRLPPCHLFVTKLSLTAPLRRAREERPRRRAPKQRYELPPPHSITSSARESTVGGIVRPRAFAVLRLITSSYLFGACTGMSAGFSPLRMRST
jgi:hypothetical protein